MAKVKKAVKKATKKASSGGRTFGRASAFLLFLLLLAGAGLGITFIPEESFPSALQPVYDTCLTARNTVIARTGMPISRYEDSALVEISEASPVRLYFAPSPKIAPALAEFIGKAKSTLDVCIYDLDLEIVADALIAAKQRKVDVRVVTDEDNYLLTAVEKLKKAHIPVVPDKRPAIMHNKFVVADAKYIWTGSFNFTENCANKNDNNALIVESPSAAACYLNKFTEYFQGSFGPNAKQKTLNGNILVGKMPLQVAFSPADGVRNRLLNELSYAKKSVYLMAFSFTSQEMADMLGELAKRGVKVRCIFDRGQAASKFSKDEYLRGCGVQIRLSPNRRGKMHHKVIIIDGETVCTGSYNFSNNAERSNDENIMILKNSALAREYIKEFKRCWKGTKGY